MKNFTSNHTILIDYDQDSSNSEDVNVKYKLNIIVPIVWSLIVFFGIIGKKRLLKKEHVLNQEFIRYSI